MRLVPLISAAILLLSSASLRAYEQATHAQIAVAAFQRSLVGSSDLLSILGLNGYAPLGDGVSYFELTDGLDGLSAYERKSQEYERNILPSLRISIAQNPIESWLAFGAIREDDNPSEDPPTPQDVAPNLRRPLNHFYDP